jgi:glycosyltransferase involved in cell wall biosynthesis
MLKILILSPDPRTPGGVSNFIQVISEKISDNVNIHHLFIGKSIDKKGLINRVFKPLIDSVKLVKKIKNNNYDIIHINPSLDIKSFLRDGLFILIINLGKPHKSLVFFHGWQDKDARLILNNKFLCFLMNNTYGRANKIIILSGEVAKQLVDMGINEEKLILFSTMFNGNIFDGIKRQNNRDEIVLLFMSRFVPGKGILELLDAFNEIQIHYPEVTLHLLGNGSEKETIEKVIAKLGLQKNVKLLGYIEGKEKAQELVNADIFILPSYSEGCPISLLEAMAAGLPVITTAVGGIPDIITDEKNGVLLTNHTPDIIKQGIEKMLESKIKRTKIGELNKKIAWENYESKIITSKIENIYRKIAIDFKEIQ